MKDKLERLSKEIGEVNKQVATDALTMSIGEIMSSYEYGDLIIDPAYQRLYRWKDWQKTKFIESILMGLPLPSIFVQQNNDGKWELIDGLQRISTILEFTGLKCKDEKNTFALTECDKITNLEQMTYEKFTPDIKRLFRKARISVMVIKSSLRESKYELFSRINSTGSPLTSQEIRNAILCDEKPELFKLIKELAKDENFSNSVSISDNEIEQAYDQELIIRFFAYREYGENEIKMKQSINKYVDDYINKIYDKNKIKNMRDEFQYFFKIINETNDKAFCGKKAGFSIAKYEAIIIGLSNKLKPKNKYNANLLKDKLANIVSEQWLTKFHQRGSNASARLKEFNDKAKEYFSEI